MQFSEFLNSRRTHMKELVDILSEKFDHVSILGSDAKSSSYRADRNMSSVSESGGECGFVIKMHDKDNFYEYSLNDFTQDKFTLAEKIVSSLKSGGCKFQTIGVKKISDEPLKKDFGRDNDFDEFSDERILSVCKDVALDVCSADENVANAICLVQIYTVSKLFISKNRELSQYYGWANGYALALYSGEKLVQARKVFGAGNLDEIISKLKNCKESLIDLAKHLAKATPIKPGVYDVITDSSITGLIAHEAFGHGVEMDMFVKGRALAKEYMGKYVASPITNMRDGAASTYSVASYFFDDDGVLAHDTQIIKDGILVAGLSDLASANQLGVEPSGNGRRESYKRKAYSRMTNTFFDKGKDKLEDMIKSIKRGYMLFDTNNGMEDPKNWQIQCTAEYGIEIVDGKLTENYVSPVVISGYVPDLLKSISMVSDNFSVLGSGMCGKGHKEWVKVSDGGPELKVKVKLG